MSATTRTVTIRQATDDDDLDALNVGNFNWWGAEKQRELFRSGPPVPKTMVVGELDGEPVGYGHGVGAAIAAHGYGIGTVYVLSHARGNGVGKRILDDIAAVVRQSGQPGVMLMVEDTDRASLGAAASWGLADHGHHFESRLDLTSLNDVAVDAATERATDQGYVVAQLADDTDEARWRATYDFLRDRFRESPDARDGGGDIPYEIFRTFMPDPWHVAMAYLRDEPAGITTVTQRPDGERRVNTFFTGVHPDHQGRGLSTALKAAHARLLRDAGWRELWTQNMEINAPILAANDRLGFERVGGYHDMGLAFG